MLGRAASLSCRTLSAAVARRILTRISTHGSAGGRKPFSTFAMRDQAANTATCGQRRSQRLLARAGSAPPKADDDAGAAEAVAAGNAQRSQPRRSPPATRRKRTADGQSLAELDVNQLQQGTSCAAPAAAEVPQEPTKRGRGSKGAAGPTRAAEQQLWASGHKAVAGVDEAGRGPLAGPVVAAACIIPEHVHIPGIDDSKQLNEAARDTLYDSITSHSEVKWAVCIVDAATIDRVNILQAAMQAMTGAVQGLDEAGSGPNYILVDGNRVPAGLAGRAAHAIVKGDGSCYCIAAASIIAKVTRDRLMLQLHEEHPQYGFAQHKGYGVPAHMAAIAQHGPCAAHRRSFEPVKSMLGWTRKSS